MLDISYGVNFIIPCSLRDTLVEAMARFAQPEWPPYSSLQDEQLVAIVGTRALVADSPPLPLPSSYSSLSGFACVSGPFSSQVAGSGKFLPQALKNALSPSSFAVQL